MSRPKLVQLLCPQRHCLAEEVFSDIPDQHAIAAMRVAVREALQAKMMQAWCRRCGAPARLWVVEVPPQSDDAHTYFDGMVSAGAQTENKLAEWKRPQGMASLN